MQHVERIARVRRGRRTVAHLSLLGALLVGAGCGGSPDAGDRVDARQQRPSDADVRSGELDSSRSIGSFGRIGGAGSDGVDARAGSGGDDALARAAERLRVSDLSDGSGVSATDRDDDVPGDTATTTTTIRDDELPEETATTTTIPRDDELPAGPTTTTIPG